ncbi:MAG: helix-turn-helix domain-containing protein [Chitinophagaceae bacterium]|jgi:transcriptional regulator GlxA family with amidase domain|nr:helix-turn-helix domain-containing protein [Chitinophagaceae bacterium]MBK9465759.1 helix-turn-helix domain-containing protein [Chitinophagaceae bacterium]MBK9661043.1 helix-turn-helix domain-containing protein [Chitinophagaceae bacterium]MBK9939312.1 helix-turn-helix domain-containing protein [Chitinophagaceae bacterium]MBL0069806.1 helix-turn-helix domain-containing protein [Chitinophagaceae bacterium]
MKKISILVPESSVPQAIADPQYLFTAVNQFMLMAGKAPVFDVELVGVKKEVKLSNGMFSVHTDRQIKNAKKTDLVFIPALFGDMRTALAKNKALVPWIQEQYAKGAEVASLCVGAFLLASTGLLNGKKCSTHWGFQNELREMFPEVEVVDGSIVTEEKRIYSSGGANSYWNLLLHLVEKYTNRETAILASKYFAIDIDRESQSAFAMFTGQKDHKDEAILKAQKYIEKNIHERITIDELAAVATMGRRSFERRFRQATNNSVLEYVQRVKIEAAKRQFESSRKNINEVMYDIGYTDTKAFRDLFKKITGLTPVEYRNKYNKQPVLN